MAGYRKTLAELPQHLKKGENIKQSVFGTYEGNFLGEKISRNGVLVATDNRIIFFGKKIFGYDMESFPFSKISSIEKSKGMLGHSITIYASGNKVKMTWINKGNVVAFTQFVNSNIGGSDINKTSMVSVLEQLEKLAKLKETGILSDEEFEKEKTRILN